MSIIERIRETFSYDPLTGTLTRIKSNYDAYIGKVVTSEATRLDGEKYPTANIIWAYHYGEWPDKIIDHKDRDRRNTKINNLRKATNSQNGYNKSYPNEFPKGVTFDASRTKCWRAQIRVDGRKINLGRFNTIEEATEAYRLAAIKHHGEFACLK